MRDLTARIIYLTDTLDQLSPEQLFGYPLDQLTQDIAEFGELEALAHRVVHFGFPAYPPADWAPRDRQALLLREERSP